MVFGDLYWKVHAIHIMHFRSCTVSTVQSNPSHLGHCTTIGTVVSGGGRGRAPGPTDGGGQMSIEARSSASGPVCGAYIQALSSDGDTELRGQ